MTKNQYDLLKMPSAKFPKAYMLFKKRLSNDVCNICFLPVFSRFLMFIYLIPIVKGISIRRVIIPKRPIIVPNMMLPHTIQKHIPTPKINAPIIAIRIIHSPFPLILIGGLFSILRHTNTVIIPNIIPIEPNIIPGLNEFHSGKRTMHIPSENITPLIVPSIRAVKLLFFI